MAINKQVKTDEFDVVSEDGRQFHVNVYTTMVDVSTMREPNAPPVPGMKSALTDEGYHCNRIDDDNWEIVSLGPLKVSRV